MKELNVMEITPFLQATVHVLEQFGITCKEGSKVNQPAGETDILTIVGITGDINGQAVLRMPMGTGLKIVSEMMGGMEVAVLNEMERSALLELGNMICGNALISLTEQGFSLNITPPALIVGSEVELTCNEVHMISSTITVDDTETVQISIMFEK